MLFTTFATVAFATLASCLPTTETTEVVAPFPPLEQRLLPLEERSADLEERAPTGYSYKNAVLWQHNLHRANHSASALTWDTNLETIARNTAKTCVYQHNTTAGGGGYGQNIAAGIPYNNIAYVISDMFYNPEMPKYNQYGVYKTDRTHFSDWGHFTQIVWKGTTRIGCATVGCPNGLKNTGSGVPPWFTVCNYGPPGNYVNDGQFSANVGRPLGRPIAHANAGQ